MTISYKIIRADTYQHSIVVRFFTDIVTEEHLCVAKSPDNVIIACRTDYNIDLPVPAPTGQELHDYIMARCPSDWLMLQEAVLNPQVDTSLTQVSSLLNQTYTKDFKGGYYTPTARQKAKTARQIAVDNIKVTTASGRVFDGDETSQGRMARAILALNAAQAPATEWVLADNTKVQVTKEELTEAMILAGLEQTRLWDLPPEE